MNGHLLSNGRLTELFVEAVSPNLHLPQSFGMEQISFI